MKFDVYGGFKIERNQQKRGVFDKKFWQQVKDENSDLTGACGCYIFALQNGKNISAWYVGKTERMTFERECFQSSKVVIYNEVFSKRRGTPLLYLLPRLTASGKKFSRPTKSGYRDIDFLETLLIGMALEQNKDLMNIHKTTLLREMSVPGVINSPRARPNAAVAQLRNSLGLNK